MDVTVVVSVSRCIKKYSQSRGFLAPALATVAVAALVWVSFSLRPAGDESNLVATSVWENELFHSSDVSPLDDRDDSEGLPEDYLAIASLFLDG